MVETIENTTNTANGICKDKSDSPKLCNKKEDIKTPIAHA